MCITDQLHHQLNLRLRHVQSVIRMVTQLNVVRKRRCCDALRSVVLVRGVICYRTMSLMVIVVSWREQQDTLTRKRLVALAEV